MRRPLSALNAAHRAAALVATALAVALTARAPRRAPPEASPVLEVAARALPVGKYEVSLATLPPRAALGAGVLRVLVLGDSGAKFLGAAMRHAQHDGREMVAERGVGSCSVLRGDVSALEDGGVEHGTSCADRWVRDVDELRPDVTLVVLGGAFLTTKACSEDFRSAYEARLDDLLTAMGDRAGRVVVARIPLPMGRWRWGDVVGRVRCLNAILDEAARTHALASLDLHALVCPTLACDDTRDGKAMRPDGLHFDGEGGRALARVVWDELARVVRAPAARSEAR